jgi:hypothetical protein
MAQTVVMDAISVTKKSPEVVTPGSSTNSR